MFKEKSIKLLNVLVEDLDEKLSLPLSLFIKKLGKHIKEECPVELKTFGGDLIRKGRAKFEFFASG